MRSLAGLALVVAALPACTCGPSVVPDDASPLPTCDATEVREFRVNRLIRSQSQYPVVSGAPGELRLALGPVDDRGRAVAIDRDGGFLIDTVYTAHALRWGPRTSIGYTRDTDADGGRVLDLQWAGRIIRLESRWPGCTLSPRNVIIDDRSAWIIRPVRACEDADPALVRLHVFDRDASETTPAVGIPFDVRPHPHEGTASEFAWGTSTDGDLWLLVDGPAPSDPIVGFRAVRYQPDGSVAAASPLLIDPALAPLVPDEGTSVFGAWIATSTSDAVVAHYEAPASETDPRGVSRFFRIASDGTIEWAIESPPNMVAARGNWELSLDEHEGGIVAVLSNDLVGDFRLLVVGEDGSRPLGDAGLPILDEWVDGGSMPPAYRRMIVASDGERGFFVAATDPGTSADQRGSTWLWRLALDGSVAWGPIEALIPLAPISGLPRWFVVPDGRGGAFVVEALDAGAYYEHIDEMGRPAFGVRATFCGEEQIGESEAFVFDRP